MYERYGNLDSAKEIKTIEGINSLQGIEDYLCAKGSMSRNKARSFINEVKSIAQQQDLFLIAQLLSSRG